MMEKTIERNFLKKGLDFALLPIQDDKMEYDDIEFNSNIEEEPPAWHEAVLKEREEEWKNRKTLSRNLDSVVYVRAVLDARQAPSKIDQREKKEERQF